MSADAQDLINRLLVQQAANQQNQPSFMGLQAPQDPSAMNAVIQKIQQEQIAQRYAQYGPGMADIARSAQTFGNAIGGMANNLAGQGQAPAQQNGPAYSVPPPATDKDGNAADNLAVAAPIPNPGATPQQSVSNMVQAARAYYNAQVQRGVDPDQAKVVTAKALVSWGAPGADEILDHANQQLLTNSKTRAETGKDTSQANMDTASIADKADEQKNRAFQQGSGTWKTTFTDPNKLYMLQTNANGETRRVEMNPPPTSATGPVDPTVVANIIQAIKDGRMAPVSPTGTFAKSSIGQAVLAAQSADPTIDATSYPTKAKALVAFATGQEGKAVTSFNAAQTHLDTLQQAASALNNGSLPIANKALNALGVQGGGTAQAAFDATKNVVANEIVKTIVPGQSAVGDREEVQKEITSAQTPQQLQAVISKYQELMSGKLGALRQQYESSTGLKNFESKLSKRSIELAHQSASYTGQFPNPTDATQGGAPGAQSPQGPSRTQTAQAPATALPPVNQQGWVLHQDAKGNRAYVSPDGSKFQVVPSGNNQQVQ